MSIPESMPRWSDAIGYKTTGQVDAFLRVAEEHGYCCADEAKGRCLSSALELCRLAREMGLSSELVAWTVTGEQFVEHWALAISEEFVVDPTRVQVDGCQNILNRISNYPKNFVNCRRYPAERLLEHYAPYANDDTPRFRSRLAWRLRQEICVIDIKRALRSSDIVGIAKSAFCFLKFAAAFSAESVIRKLENRRSVLSARLIGR